MWTTVLLDVFEEAGKGFLVVGTDRFVSHAAALNGLRKGALDTSMTAVMFVIEGMRTVVFRGFFNRILVRISFNAIGTHGC